MLPFLVVLLPFLPNNIHGQPLVRSVSLNSTALNAEPSQLILQRGGSQNVTCIIELEQLDLSTHHIDILFIHLGRSHTMNIVQAGTVRCEQGSDGTTVCHKGATITDSLNDELIQCKIYVHDQIFYSKALVVTVEGFRDISRAPSPTPCQPIPTSATETLEKETASHVPASHVPASHVPASHVPAPTTPGYSHDSSSRSSSSLIGLNTLVVSLIFAFSLL